MSPLNPFQSAPGREAGRYSLERQHKVMYPLVSIRARP